MRIETEEEFMKEHYKREIEELKRRFPDGVPLYSGVGIWHDELRIP